MKVDSMLALSRVLDALQCIRQGRVEPRLLAEAIVAHLRANQEAYGTDAWVPKHHFALHLPGQLARHGTLISLFTCERRHRLLKRFGGRSAEHDSIRVWLDARHNVEAFGGTCRAELVLQNLVCKTLGLRRQTCKLHWTGQLPMPLLGNRS